MTEVYDEIAAGTSGSSGVVAQRPSRLLGTELSTIRPCICFGSANSPLPAGVVLSASLVKSFSTISSTPSAIDRVHSRIIFIPKSYEVGVRHLARDDPVTVGASSIGGGRESRRWEKGEGKAVETKGEEQEGRSKTEEKYRRERGGQNKVEGKSTYQKMGILTLLHLRRSSPWEKPTLLDQLLASPFALIVATAYQVILFLRGHPFRPPPGRPPIRVVCLSDTHDRVLDHVPEGDLLIHGGDLTEAGTVKDIQRQVDWLAGLEHREK